MSLLACLYALTLTAPAAPVAGPEPELKVGLPGKDVIWVPTPEPVIDRMLAMAQVTADDVVVDLGAGDGRMVLRAAQTRGARAIGVEYNQDLVDHARRAAKRLGLDARRFKMVREDLYKTDLRAATVIMLYLLPEMNQKLRAKLLHLKPGTRIVAHQFGIPEWEPDETSWHDRRAAHLWIVPAHVAGGWRVALPGGAALDLDIEQKYQRIKGRALVGEQLKAGLRDPALRGDHIRFTLVDAAGVLHEFTGRVVGERMEGTVLVGGAAGPWTAARRAD